MKIFKDLQLKALNFWPIELSEREKNASIIPLLLESQDKFISLLNVSDASPEAWKSTLKNSTRFPSNLFVKHLMVLSDIGGERLMRFKRNLPIIFKDSEMEYSWDGKIYSYKFNQLNWPGPWNNKNLFVDGENLLEPHELNQTMEDVCMLILFGGSSTAEYLPTEIQEKCTIGTILGKNKELDTFVHQRYIWVSRITGGATANKMGQLAQRYVLQYLKDKLPKWDFSNKNIPGISQNDGRTPISFDIVAYSPKEKYCAIEISFQVTTNSTIERKAGQARARYDQLNRKGHKIAYVIDGAGNFERRSALSTIIKYSHYIVTFQKDELDKLSAFLKGIDN